MPLHTYPLVVRSVTVASSNVRVFVLAREDGGALPQYEPGAHLLVGVNPGSGRRESRSYSLTNSVDRPPLTYRIAVRLDPEGHGGSRFMHESVRAGTTLEVAGPQNHFEMDRQGRPRLFIAGGIGITPLMAMAYRSAARNEAFALHYVARSPELMPFRSELITAFGDRVFLYSDQGHPEDGLDLRQLLAQYGHGGPVYVCGPPGMIDETLRLAAELRLVEGTVRFERFSSTAAHLSSDRPFELVLRRSRRTLTVPSWQSMLDVMLAAGIDVPYDCRVGECGSCVSSVIEGTPDHRDAFLNKKQIAAGNVICPCVSRAKGPQLVLDL